MEARLRNRAELRLWPDLTSVSMTSSLAVMRSKTRVISTLRSRTIVKLQVSPPTPRAPT